MKNNRISLSLLLAFFTFNFTSLTFAQSANPKWVYILDGFYDADVTDIEVDKQGNTYVSANYSGTISIPELKADLPRAPHVHGLILKLDKNGKPIWVRSVVSVFDNRINDITLAANGDVLFTGFADGKAKFGGKKDTLRFGRDKERGEYHHPQNVYAARYSSEGEPIWVKNFGTPFGQGLSIAINSKEETYFNLYYTGFLKNKDSKISEIPKESKIESKSVTIKLDKNGEFEKLQELSYFKQSSYIHNHKVCFDTYDNMYQYGTFYGKIAFSATDSFSNDAYLEGLDSYLVKYNQEGEILWTKQIGGQNVQFLNEIQISPSGKIYGAGYYDFECSIGNGISLVQKSKYEWKSGSSFFYFALTADGDLDFIRYEQQGQYSTSFAAASIALDDFDHAHIVGTFNDTVNVDGKMIYQSFREATFFYSCWDNNTLLELNRAGISSNYFALARKISIGGGNFAAGGLYAGDDSKMMINGKKHKLTLNEHGRSSFIYGGTVPTKDISEPLIALESKQNIYLKDLKPLLACLKPEQTALPNVWFPTEDSIPSRETWLSETPCGREVAEKSVSLFPNPSRGNASLVLTGMNGGNALVDIFSESGNLIFSQKVGVPEDQFTLNLNLNGIANGIYFVRIVHGGFEKALRLVKVD